MTRAAAARVSTADTLPGHGEMKTQPFLQRTKGELCGLCGALSRSKRMLRRLPFGKIDRSEHRSSAKEFGIVQAADCGPPLSLQPNTKNESVQYVPLPVSSRSQGSGCRFSFGLCSVPPDAILFSVYVRSRSQGVAPIVERPRRVRAW